MSITLGNALDYLRSLPDEMVDNCVTSPPYFKQRHYLNEDDPFSAYEVGKETSLDEYINNLVAIFTEVKRVLKPTGTIWVNLGDSYSGGGGYSPESPSNVSGASYASRKDGTGKIAKGSKIKDLPDGNLMLVPERIGLALQASGWIIRNAVTWAKTSPMPNSVKDRLTTSTERIWFAVKNNSKDYFWVHRDGSVADGYYNQRTKPAPDYRYVWYPTGEEQTEEPDDWQNNSNWGRRNLWKAYQYFYDQEAERTPMLHALRVLRESRQAMRDSYDTTSPYTATHHGAVGKRKGAMAHLVERGACLGAPRYPPQI